MKSTKFKTLGVCIATLAFLLMAVGSSSSGSSSNSSDSNGATTTTATTTKAATTKKVETVSYSTNDKNSVKDGNKGLYAYKNLNGTYDNYYLIDFDDGYVYNFSDGNSSSTGDRVKIVSGDLNDVLVVTYHDVDGSSWSYGLHFKWQRQPDHLVLQDQNGFEYDFTTTNLEKALKVLSGKTITDYSDSSLHKVDKSDYPTMQPKTETTTSAPENTDTTSISDENSASSATTSAPATSETVEDLLTMIDVTGVTLDKAKTQLKDIGFSNISEESDNGKVIILDINWTVISQSVEAGTKIDKNTKIILTCSKGGTSNTTTSVSTQSNDESISNNNASIGEKNALKSAKSYLAFTAFSYKGLVGQLEYEGYSNSEATYAADNCGANWKEQALKNAKSYLEYTAFSYKGLISQLEYEKYTHEEAVYGADNCGANWNEQAAKCAQSYLAYSSFSRSQLIEQLEYEGFTHDQAVYGVTANGY